MSTINFFNSCPLANYKGTSTSSSSSSSSSSSTSSLASTSSSLSSSSSTMIILEAQNVDFNPISLVCPNNKLISVLTVLYGNSGTGCACTSAPGIITAFCNGKSACSMTVFTSPQLTDPCPGTLKTLAIQYSCV